MNTKLDVATFMRAGEHNVETNNAGFYHSRKDQANLYFSLVKEEYNELVTAIEKEDIVETADACADLIWAFQVMIYLMLYEFGIIINLLILKQGTKDQLLLI